MHHETVPLYPSATLPLKESYAMGSSSVAQASAPASVPVTGQTIHPNVLLGPENTVTTCPFCSASVKTAVKYTMTSRTHIAAALYALCCCCCCIGYCSDSTKNSDHYCPNCQRYLGTYQNCCCCIGYCSDSTKNSDHYCPNCQRYLGTYQK